MASVLVSGIRELVTNDRRHGSELGILRDAAVVVEGGRIAWVGHAARAPMADREHDLGGRAVVPGFVDSHSHLVFGGDRHLEFAARMSGQRYDGGGIASTIAATRAASDEELRGLVEARVTEMAAQGTTTVEIKSGYGGSTRDEVRSLQIAREFTAETTYLGAHYVPDRNRIDEQLMQITGPMLEACAPYARWIDVFCEPASQFAFDYEESKVVLKAGLAAGLEARVHGNQLAPGPGVQLAVELDAAAVDHCTYLSDADIDALAASNTVATLLPGVEFSTRSPYPNGRALIEAGVTVALATDCNPGTNFSSSMPFVIALAVCEMGMTPEQAMWAATAGGARALRRDDIGVIKAGALAHLTVLDAPSYVHLAYRAGVPIAWALRVN